MLERLRRCICRHQQVEDALLSKNQRISELERKLSEAEAMFAAAEAHNIVFVREDVPPSLSDPLGSRIYRVYHR